MKKFSSLILATLLSAPVAFAGSINLEMRDDLTSTSYNDAALAASTNNKNNYKFNLQTLRVDAKGSASDTVSYRLRFRLNKDAVAAKKRETGNDWVDFAFLTQKLSDNFSITGGKFNSDIGGLEGMTPGSDLYLTSFGFSQISNLLYHTGVKFSAAFDTNTIDFEVANQEYDSLSGTGLDQNRSVYGLVYKGAFLEKTLMPVLSYFVSPQSTGTVAGSGATTDTSKYTYTNAGIRYIFNGLTADFDYGMIGKKETVNATTDENSTNAVLKVSYPIDAWKPALKYYTSAKTTTSAGTDTKTTYDGAELSAEMKASDVLRYHFAYNMANTKPATGDTQTTTMMYAGLKLYTDILK